MNMGPYATGIGQNIDYAKKVTVSMTGWPGPAQVTTARGSVAWPGLV